MAGKGRAKVRALTLKHPWPYVIARFGKRIENRTWKPPGWMVPGTRFALHGGAMPTQRDLDDIESDLRFLFGKFRDVAISETVRLQRIPQLGDGILQGIFAVATFGGVVEESDSYWFDGPYGWILSDVVLLDRPVTIKGKQGLWDIPPEAMAGIPGYLGGDV